MTPLWPCLTLSAVSHICILSRHLQWLHFYYGVISYIFLKKISLKCIIGIAIFLVHFNIKDTLVPDEISVFYSISVGPAGLMEFKQLSIFALFMHFSHHCVENLHLSSVRLYNESFRMRIPANARHFSYWYRHYVPECTDTKCIHWAVSNLTPGKADDIKCKIYTKYSIYQVIFIKMYLCWIRSLGQIKAAVDST